MSFITASRLATFIIIIIAALVTLGITIHFIVLESTVPDGFTPVLVYPLVVAILALLIAPVFIIIGLIRTRAWLTMIVVEFSTLSVLFLLWIVLAALINNASQITFPLGCSNIGFDTFEFDEDTIQALEEVCREYAGLTAAGFIASIFTLIYLLVLLTFCIIGKTRGNAVWLVSVPEAGFFKQNNVSANLQYELGGSDIKPGFASTPGGSSTVLAVPMMNGVPVGPAVQMPSQQVMPTQVGLPMSGTQTQMQMGYSMTPQV